MMLESASPLNLKCIFGKDGSRQFFYACVLIFAIFFTFPGIAQSTSADSSQTLQDSLAISNPEKISYANVRGFEKAESKPGTGFRKAFHYLFWPPRTIIDVTLTSAGFSAVIIDETKIVKTFEEIFLLYEDKLGWFPLLNFVTGSPKGLGLSLFYRTKYFGVATKGAYSNREIWGVKGEINHIFFARRYFWDVSFTWRLNNDNNFKFYGIGNDPRNDARSYFLNGNELDYGIYSQQRILLDFNLGIRTSANWEFFLTTFYQKRTVNNPAKPHDYNIGKVFDLENLPGANIKSKKLYNEIAFRFDNRPNLSIISPGWRIEAYTGISTGFKNDNERLFRSGLDVAAFIPLVRENRLLVPRVTFNMVEDINGLDEIAFVEYPRHLTFRGINTKNLLRSDKYMMVPSLEYQWPLTFHLSGHLFADYLLVADSPTTFTTRNAPWAVGFGIDAHTRLNEIARFYITYGSEGLFLKFSFGLSSLFKNRSDWR